jgi:transcriptional regulator with XRE-family HTH domain
MNIPYLVRHARLVLGQTQSQFAERFEVDDGTVSRWERGKVRPAPAVVAQLREIALKSMLGDELVRASLVWKFVSPIGDLRHPCTVSKGTREALTHAGIPSHDLSKVIKEVRYGTTPELSGAAALEAIQSAPLWIERRVVYAEAHCIAVSLRAWINLMVTPLPDRPFALIEFAKAPEEGGFWVRVVCFEDLTRRPR